MVRNMLARFTAPIRGLHQAAYLLAALTLASQVLALLRDRTFAHSFGASPVLDLYYAAFRVPDLVFALVSSLVSAYVLIPRITGMDRESIGRLLSQSASFLLIVGGGINTPEKARRACDSGADIIVVGNALEKNRSLLKTRAEQADQLGLI